MFPKASSACLLIIGCKTFHSSYCTVWSRDSSRWKRCKYFVESSSNNLMIKYISLSLFLFYFQYHFVGEPILDITKNYLFVHHSPVYACIFYYTFQFIVSQYLVCNGESSSCCPSMCVYLCMDFNLCTHYVLWFCWYTAFEFAFIELESGFKHNVGKHYWLH